MSVDGTIHQLELFKERSHKTRYTRKLVEARSCLKSGCFRLALKHYDEAIRLRPEYKTAWRERGIVLHEMGCRREAFRSYHQAGE